MSSNNDVVIHIGLPRSGTTFLQKEIFKKSPKVKYIDRRKDKSFQTFKEGIKWYLSDDFPSFLSKNKTNVISDEMICYIEDRKKIMKKFKKIFFLLIYYYRVIVDVKLRIVI